MRRKINTIIVCLIMFVLSILLLETTSLATGSFAISSDKTSLNVGETTTLKIKVTDCEGAFKFSSSDSSIVSISDTQEWIGDKGDSYSITLTAKKAGTAKITVIADNVSDKDFNEIRDSKNITITVTEPKKEEETKTETPKVETPKAEETKEEKIETPAKSSDASLKSITVGGKKYNNPNTTITANSVSADTSSIKIEAQTNDSKAKVTGTGTKELITGTNKFTLKVTAEDGSTKSYTVKVTKLEEEDITPNIVDENQQEEKNEDIIQELRLISLVVDGAELIPEFSAEVFEYSVFIANAVELNITAEANLEDTLIEITGNKELTQGENIAIIKLSKDEKVVEYKVIINNASLGLLQGNSDDKKDIIEEEQKTKKDIVGMIKDWWNNSGLLTIIFAGILGLLSAAIAFVISIYKYSKLAIEKTKHLNQKEN